MFYDLLAWSQLIESESITRRVKNTFFMRITSVWLHLSSFSPLGSLKTLMAAIRYRWFIQSFISSVGDIAWTHSLLAMARRWISNAGKCQHKTISLPLIFHNGFAILPIELGKTQEVNWATNQSPSAVYMSTPWSHSGAWKSHANSAWELCSLIYCLAALCIYFSLFVYLCGLAGLTPLSWPSAPALQAAGGGDDR